MQKTADGLKAHGTVNQIRIEETKEKLADEKKKANAMPATTDEEKKKKEQRLSDLKAAEEELARVEDWNKRTALDRAAEMNGNGKDVAQHATADEPAVKAETPSAAQDKPDSGELAQRSQTKAQEARQLEQQAKDADARAEQLFSEGDQATDSAKSSELIQQSNEARQEAANLRSQAAEANAESSRLISEADQYGLPGNEMANLQEAAAPGTPATPASTPAAEPAKPAPQAGLSNTESGYTFTPKEGAEALEQTSTGNSSEGTIRYFGTSADGKSGYAVYPDGSVYSYSGTPGSAVLGTVNSSTGTSAVGKIATSPSSSGFSSYTPYSSSSPVATTSTGVAAPSTSGGAEVVNLQDFNAWSWQPAPTYSTCGPGMPCGKPRK